MPKDAGAIILSAFYIGAVIGASELLRTHRRRGDELTRKVVHVGVGLWIIPTMFLFTKWYWAAALPAGAVIGNALSMRYKLMRGIERPGSRDYGTVLFPLSFFLCIALFFDSPHRAAAAVGIIIMALGDAAAAAVGMRYGRHPYVLFGAKKSREGSAAMFGVSLFSAFLTMRIFGEPVGAAAAASAITAVVATALEAAGRWGLDNLTVPVASAAVAHALLGAFVGGGA